MEEHHCITLFNYLGIDSEKIPLCVETGTHRGWGTEQWAKLFKKVITIELSAELFSYCTDTYDLPNVNFLQGSSHDVLSDIIGDINEKYFLFLDAHGSGGDTTYDESVGRFGAPVLKEIQAVSDNPPEILVLDDLSDFNNISSYPSPEEIHKEVSKIGEYSSSVFNEGAFTKGALIFDRRK